jgi:hypothetical protein
LPSAICFLPKSVNTASRMMSPELSKNPIYFPLSHK